MKLCHWLLALILIGAASRPAAAQTVTNRGFGVVPAIGDTPLGAFHVLAIGINSYLQWPPLKTAVNDAQAVAAVLQEHYDFPPQNIHTLFDAQATRANLIAKLRELATTLKPDDSLFIFYAGHGHLDDLTGDGSWIPVEASRDDASTWIDNDKIKGTIRAMKARHVLLVSDSCFAGEFFKSHRAGLPVITDDYVRTAFGKLSRQALTSGGLEPVVDAGAEGHSVFTFFLLKQLRENRAPYLLPVDLFCRVRDGMSANQSLSTQQPVLGILDGTGGEIGGEFVLFRKGMNGSLDAILQKKMEQMSVLEQREAEAKKAQQTQQALLDSKASKISDLDRRIEEMKKRVGDTGGGDGTLDQLLAMVKQKEVQGQELEKLRQSVETEKSQRTAELQRLRSVEENRLRTECSSDWAKLLEVWNSRYADTEVKHRAWSVFCTQWGLSPRTGLARPEAITKYGDWLVGQGTRCGQVAADYRKSIEWQLRTDFEADYAVYRRASARSGSAAEIARAWRELCHKWEVDPGSGTRLVFEAGLVKATND